MKQEGSWSDPKTLARYGAGSVRKWRLAVYKNRLISIDEDGIYKLGWWLITGTYSILIQFCISFLLSFREFNFSGRLTENSEYCGKLRIKILILRRIEGLFDEESGIF
ncbi:hypothetical protein [Endozoicomonas sp. ONNA2]|uniref:hypothetical protein n=1 Tax=Endozoicomonas sp. ONNA2 TaxID=2828741 RepID=UPI002149226C|nr:hypothetical protein [Endozoicomonas sp. ONNA2]